jgi:hypothetical protein
LRPGKRPGGHEIRAFLRRLVGAIRAFWPRVEILLRADSHYACPQVFDWCRENRVDWVLGLAPNAALRRHVEALEKTTAERFTAVPARGKVRRFAQFHDAAGSWSRVERIIARVEAGAAGIDTRFIVTNLEGGRAKLLYERLYCARSNRCLLEHANYLDPHRSATGDAIARDGNRDHVYRRAAGDAPYRSSRARIARGVPRSDDRARACGPCHEAPRSRRASDASALFLCPRE